MQPCEDDHLATGRMVENDSAIAPSSEEQDDGGDWSVSVAGVSVPIMVLIVAGVAALLIILFAFMLCCCCCRRRKVASVGRSNSQNEKMSNASANPGSHSTAQAGSVVRPLKSLEPSPPPRNSTDTLNTKISGQNTGNLPPNNMPPMYSMSMLSGYAFGSGMKLNTQDSVYSWADTSVGEGGAALATIPVMATPECASVAAW